jgi:LPS export ABC transporter protein LptC
MRPYANRRFPMLAAALSALLLGIAGCDQTPQVSSVPVAGQLPDTEVSDFVATETDRGAVQWKMYARSAATYRNRNVVIARDMRIDFFDEKGQRSSTMTAREGEMNDQTHDMTARGDVVIQATEGTRMTTDLLHFLNKQQHVETESFVRVDRAGDVLTGYGFESDPELKDFQFKRQVKATVRTRSGGSVESRKGTP